MIITIIILPYRHLYRHRVPPTRDAVAVYNIIRRYKSRSRDDRRLRHRLGLMQNAYEYVNKTIHTLIVVQTSDSQSGGRDPPYQSPTYNYYQGSPILRAVEKTRNLNSKILYHGYEKQIVNRIRRSVSAVYNM